MASLLRIILQKSWEYGYELRYMIMKTSQTKMPTENGQLGGRMVDAPPEFN